MENEEFLVPGAEEVYKLIEEVNRAGRGLNEEDDENPGRFMANIENVLSKISQLVEKCDQISDDDDEDLDFDELFEAKPEE